MTGHHPHSGVTPPTPRRSASAAGARAALALALLLAATTAAAEPPPAATVTAAPQHEVEARLLLALPAALPTGMMTGVEAAYTRGRGWLRYGASASWGTATEYTLTEIVTNEDMRLRVFGLAQHAFGRGTLGLRLGVGGTLVYEDRTRAQGARAGLTGSALSSSTVAMLPGADLEARVTLRILRDWALTVGGGPSLHILNGSARAGWLGGLGVAWLH